MALYHTYRPQSFDDVLGQPHIVGVLRSALVHDRIGHAYLMSGPRGVGKTSIARILAKAINCTTSESQRPNHEEDTPQTVPCNSCRACTSITDGSALDVIEIDAASNRGIDEIRELRDRVRFAPSTLAKKVYIIDEVHMLTKEAFNALLKTLEEPPTHVVFILATTELAKIPETIFSRCQHFQFRRAAPEALVSHLQAILAQEQRTIEQDALDLVVLRAEGSYRDALSAVEQVVMASDEPAITADSVRSLFGLPAESTALDLLAAIAVGDREQILTTLETLSAQGVSLESFSAELIRLVRLLLFVATLGAERTGGGSEAFRTAAPALLRSFSSQQLIDLLKGLMQAASEARTSAIPTLPLELALLGFGESSGSRLTHQPNTQQKQLPHPIQVPAPAATPQQEKATDASPKKDTKNNTTENKVNIQKPEISTATQTGNSDAAVASPTVGALDAAQWSTLRRTIATADSALGMLMNELDIPAVSHDVVTLTVPFKFHADLLHSKKSANLLAKLFGEVIGRPVAVSCVVAPSDRRGKRSLTLTDGIRGTALADPVGALSEL